ncbi:uncharacterized protein LOC130677957 [Microplitis mediator]|uniref:uncharacterized protein LOC130677957 n=1 Tax=Microplitis mediator TaxID=375433 RepID=UPI002554910C|nr:uncharacterized protein LOC130677957 [Microplitis mediator]
MMNNNNQLFNVNDLFDSYEQVKKQLELYSNTEKYKFSVSNSKTLSSVCNEGMDYNPKLIYDERYFKCSVNPKPTTLKKFQAKNPGVNVVLCPAILVLRTTQDKKHLKVTKFEPKHDHDPSAPPRLQIVNTLAVENDIGHNEDLSRENYPTAPSTSHVEIIDQPLPIYESINRQDNNLQPIVVESNDHQNPDSIDVEVLGSQLQAANTSVTNDHSIDVPIIFNENFETLLLKLQVNIMATQNNEEKKKKMIEINKMLASLDMNMNDSCLPPATSNSVLQSNIGCLTIFSSRSRGRGRGRRNRVIGLSASQRSTKCNSFQNLKNTTKVIEILSLIIKDKSVINRIVLGYKKINHNDLIHLQPGNICDALASEIITDDIIEKFFEPDAYANYKNIIKMKCNSDDWQCKICGSNLNTDYSVECDRCLFWSHWRCVSLTEEPLNEWFCPHCKK